VIRSRVCSPAHRRCAHRESRLGSTACRAPRTSPFRARLRFRGRFPADIVGTDESPVAQRPRHSARRHVVGARVGAWTDRTAIDSRCSHTREERAVIGGVAPQPCLIASISIKDNLAGRSWRHAGVVRSIGRTIAIFGLGITRSESGQRLYAKCATRAVTVPSGLENITTFRARSRCNAISIGFP